MTTFRTSYPLSMLSLTDYALKCLRLAWHNQRVSFLHLGPSGACFFVLFSAGSVLFGFNALSVDIYKCGNHLHTSFHLCLSTSNLLTVIPIGLNDPLISVIGGQHSQ